VLKNPIVLADSVSKSICQNFFARAAVVNEGENIIFHDNDWYKQRLYPPGQSQNEDNFATFYLGLEFLHEAEKEKNNGKGDSASVPSRFASLKNHSWYCCLFFASDLMHNSTSYVIKQLVHAFNCALSSYGALGKFGEHSRSYQLLRFFRALQTSPVLHNSIASAR